MKAVHHDAQSIAPRIVLLRPDLGHVTDALLVVTVVMLPIYPWIARLGGGWAQGGRLALGLALASLVLIEARARSWRRALPLAIALAILAGIQLLALIRAPELDFAVREFINWTLYFPVALLVWSRGRLQLVGAATMAAGLVLLAGVALQAADVLGGTWGIPSADDDRLTRFTSFLGNPNDFGLTMALCSIAALVTALSSPRRHRVMLGLSGVFALGVVASTSRGSLIALLVGLSIVGGLVLRGRHRDPKSRPATLAAILVIGLVGAATLALTAGLDLRHSIVGGALNGDASVDARVERWRILLSERPSPVFGRGYGGFVSALDRKPPNGLLNPSAENGLVGWRPLTGSAPLTLVSAPVRQGDKAVRVRGREPGSVARLSIGGARVSVVPDRRYRFSVVVKPNGPARRVDVRLSAKWQRRASSSYTEELGSRRSLVGGAWRVVSDEFRAPPDAEFADTVLQLGAGRDSVVSAYVDDATFARIAPVFGGADPPVWAVRREVTVDNSVLRLFLEEGLLGMTSLVTALVLAWRVRPWLSGPYLVPYLPVIVLAMLTVRALTVDLLAQPLWSFVLWLSVGLLAALCPIARRA